MDAGSAGVLSIVLRFPTACCPLLFSGIVVWRSGLIFHLFAENKQIPFQGGFPEQ